MTYGYKVLLGFILTMWYVNAGQDFIVSESAYSFILTMWYVNEVRAEIEKTILDGFILTMWYVNFSTVQSYTV